MVMTVTRKWDKDVTNAELINRLDRDYNLFKHWPQSEHPTRLEFESNSDPTKHPSFIRLMYVFHKECKVTLHGVNDYFIEIDDAKKNR